jgi:hypothetical protein
MGEAKARKAAAERARLARKVPENLLLLHDSETNYQVQSIKAIEADPEMMDHVEFLESVMDYIHLFALRPPKNTDHETVQLLSARMFNDLAAAYGQLVRGYYQIAAMILRDVMEIAFLLALFNQLGAGRITRPDATTSAQRRSAISSIHFRATARRRGTLPIACSASKNRNLRV